MRGNRKIVKLISSPSLKYYKMFWFFLIHNLLYTMSRLIVGLSAKASTQLVVACCFFYSKQ